MDFLSGSKFAFRVLMSYNGLQFLMDALVTLNFTIKLSVK